MTNLKVIALDVDLCLVNVIPKWMTYLKSLCTEYDAVKYKKDLLYGQVHYNLTKYFKLIDGVHGFEFWEQPDLYDDATLMDGAYEVVEELYKAGHEIVFVSYSFAGHLNSKVDFLKRSFPFIEEDDFHFISTKSKGFVRCDALVDDRASFLNQMPESVTLIKMNTNYTQCEEISRPVHEVDNWEDIKLILL